jgi:hypothetical protein
VKERKQDEERTEMNPSFCKLCSVNYHGLINQQVFYALYLPLDAMHLPTQDSTTQKNATGIRIHDLVVGAVKTHALDRADTVIGTKILSLQIQKPSETNDSQ